MENYTTLRQFGNNQSYFILERLPFNFHLSLHVIFLSLLKSNARFGLKKINWPFWKKVVSLQFDAKSAYNR